MSEDTQIASKGQEVETKDQEELKPNTEEVKTEEVKETTEAPKVDEVDYEALLKSQDEIIVKLQTEKDNYRQGMLKAKGKIQKEEEQEPELSDDERIRAIVKEEFYNSEIAEAQRKKDELLAKLVRENKELKVANRNSGKANLSASGSGSEERNSEVSPLSPELKSELIARANKLGFNPEKYIETYIKNSRKNN